MKKILTLSLLMIGCLSTVGTTKSEHNNDIDLYATGYENGAHDLVDIKPFSLGSVGFMYRCSLTDSIYGAGNSYTGQLGNGGSGSDYISITKSFAMYKSNTVWNTFSNPVDFSIDQASLIIDNDGGLYTTGFNSVGQVGNGYTSTVTSLNLRTVNGASSYSAKAVASGSNVHYVLLEGDILCAAGSGDDIGFAKDQTKFTRIDGLNGLPASEDMDGIVDFGGGYRSSYVLFGNGDLYRCYDYIWEHIDSNVKMMSFLAADGKNVTYVNDDNEVYYMNYLETTPNLITDEITTNIKQIIATDYAWGYLTSENDLYLSTPTEGVVAEAENSSFGSNVMYKIEEKVVYADIAGKSDTSQSYAILTQEGKIKLWGENTNGKFGNGSTSTIPYGFAYTPSNGIYSDVDDFKPVEPDTSTPEVTPTDFSECHPILRTHTANSQYGSNINSPYGIVLLYGTYLKLDFSNFALSSGETISINIKSENGEFNVDWIWCTLQDDKMSNYPIKPNSYTITSKLLDSKGSQVGGSNIVNYQIVNDEISLSLSSSVKQTLQCDSLLSSDSIYDAAYDNVLNGLIESTFVTANKIIYSANTDSVFSTTSGDNISVLTTKENWDIYFTEVSVTSFNESDALYELEENKQYKIWIFLTGIEHYEINDVLSTSFSVASSTNNNSDNNVDVIPPVVETPSEVLPESTIVTVTTTNPIVYATSGASIVAILWAIVATVSKKRR